MNLDAVILYLHVGDKPKVCLMGSVGFAIAVILARKKGWEGLDL